MERVQFYPDAELAKALKSDAENNGVSVSRFVTDLLEEYYGISKKPGVSITQLTARVLEEVRNYINANNGAKFDLFTASPTYRGIKMTNGKKPSAVRASIGKSFAAKIGVPPFENVRKCVENGKQRLSVNNALVYETF